MGKQNRISRNRSMFASAVGLLAVAVKFLMPAQVELQSKHQGDLQEDSIGVSAERGKSDGTGSARSSVTRGSPANNRQQPVEGQAGSGNLPASASTQSNSFGSLENSSDSTSSAALDSRSLGSRDLTDPAELAVQPRLRGHAQPAALDTVGMVRLDPSIGAGTSGDAEFGTAAARLASMERVKIQFPSSQEMIGLEGLRPKPPVDEGALQKAVPVREPSAADRAAKEQKELAKIKRDIGLPAPKAKLDGALYDPWAREYDSVVRSEEAKANKLAQEALKARQDEQRARRKSLQ
jgi:hypothetical protein